MMKIGRPALLEALCLLSFLANGAGFIIYSIAGLFFNRINPRINEMGSVPGTYQLSPPYFLAFGLLFAIAFYGVYQMWKLKRSGFCIYIAARLSIVAYPLIMMGPQAFSAVVAIFSLLFIILYSSQLKKMKNHSLEDMRMFSR